jgi:RTX calcium-binding nonapeptide repeat (4 copies)
VTVKSPCTVHQTSETTAICPAAGIASVEIDLGDGTDTLEQYAGGENTTKALPLTVALGEGDDMYSYFERVPVKVDGGHGDDTVSTGDAADEILGGAGDDDLGGSSGKDRLEGGPGDDSLTGGDGRDSLTPGKGKDFAGGNAGNDTFDWRNGEVDKGSTNCAEGRDTVIQDPKDQIVEYKQPGGSARFVERACERVKGQPAPAPVRIQQKGAAPPFRLLIDLVSAFGGRFEIEVFEGRTLIAKGRVRHEGTTTTATLKTKAEPSKPVFRATVRITNKDSGGRTGTSTTRITLGSNF